MNNTKRILELDVLRGIAALSLVVYHYTTWYNQIYHHSQEVILYFPKGKYGVELFFIISGFVILMTLEKTKTTTEFIRGRFLRLYPAYWAAIILTFTVVSIAGLPTLQRTLKEAIVNLTMFQAFLQVPDVDKVYWTLAYELSFYILMLFLYKIKLIKHIDRIAIVWLFIMSLIALLENKFNIIIDSRIECFLLLKTANLFIIGMMFYRNKMRGLSIKRYTIIFVCILFYNFVPSWEDHFGKPTLILCLFIILFELIVKNKLKFINQTYLLFLGTISYSLYLIHQNIGYVLIRFFYKLQLNPNISIFIAIFVSIILSSTITFFIEKPIMHYSKSKIYLNSFNKN